MADLTKIGHNWVKYQNYSLKIIKRIGNWEIGFIQYRSNPRVFLIVRGKEYQENPIIYMFKYYHTVGYDNPHKIPNSVKKYMSKNIIKLYNQQKRYARGHLNG